MNLEPRHLLPLGLLALTLGGCVTTDTPAPADLPPAAAQEPAPPPAEKSVVDPAALSALSKKTPPREGVPVDPSAYSALTKKAPPKEGVPLDPSAYSALSKKSAPRTEAASASEPWSYAGETGPAHWGELGRGGSACSGSRQSPVELGAPEVTELQPVRFRYRVARVSEPRLANLPRLILANGGGIELGGEFYALFELHIHVPAEHGVEGQPRAALEVQLLHRSEKGRWAGVAVLMDERAEENVAIHRILNAIPGATAIPSAGVAMFNPANLLPGSARYVTYEGSLTTPPCTEGVTWVVMQERTELSTEQLAGLRRRFPGSARPWQPLNGRRILSD